MNVWFHLHGNIEVVADHGAHFLGSELERTVTDKQNRSPAIALILGSESSTLASANRPADATPEDLAESGNTFGESSVPDTEVGSTSLGDDDVVGDEELANARPEPGLGDRG